VTGDARPSRWSLYAIFFASGAAALVLENLWFRQAARLLGNTTWATSIVLAAFMAGLALGGALAGRAVHRIARPIRTYAKLELAIAASAGAVILALPHATAALAPVFRALAGSATALDACRLVVAFALMVVPAAAMGATLPVLVHALTRSDPAFHRVLGRLYGWNTLGAVAGSLAVELALVPRLGLAGTAGVAIGLDAAAAVGALALSRAAEATSAAEPPSAAAPLSPRARRLLLAGLLSGAIVLALEVVWSRFLALYVLTTPIALGIMLAVVLAGIAAGGLAASLHEGDADAPARIALIAGILVVAGYRLFPGHAAPGSDRWQDALAGAIELPLPVAFASGLLFARLADATRAELGDAGRATGLYTAANTFGAMLGALVGGFALLPAIGIDGALFVLAAGYVVVALCAAPARGTPRSLIRRGALAATALGLATALAVFPFGRLAERDVPAVVGPLATTGSSLVDFRETASATLALLEVRFAGQVYAHQLVTDGFAMSSSLTGAQRYMKEFVYWPVSVRPDVRRALLICYGVGQTAKALTDTAALDRIDIVDTSRAILGFAAEIFAAGASPLDDPRVAVHVEDGRFFLQTSDDRYDIITGEPPPPQLAGVADLYTREYFALVRDHLSAGGVTTYWLPVHDLSVDDARAIMAAFCAVFPDCSLWDGNGLDWMLVGTNDFAGGASETQLAAPWRDGKVAPELAGLGFEAPEQLAATFIADADTLAEWIAGAPPLDDDHPARLGHRFQAIATDDTVQFARWMDPAMARVRFAASPLVARLFPAAFRARAQPYFAIQRVLDIPPMAEFGYGVSPGERLAAVRFVQSQTALRAPVAWLLGMPQRRLDLLDGAPVDSAYAVPRAIRALVDRRYTDAAAGFAAAPATEVWTRSDLDALAAYSREMAGH
jgi:predicted membrane-bound spermidine synthase